MSFARLNRRSAIATMSLILASTACRAAPEQSRSANRARADLYNCEGCDGILERPAERLTWQSRIGPENEPGEPMRIEGRVYQSDGTTPAPDVIVYAYQTNSQGLYANGTPRTEWSRRHGRLRGWVETDALGRYAFATIKPAPYPTRDLPAHVHLTILEPGRRSYYVDDIVFDGEFGVTDVYRKAQELRGGSGILKLSRDSSGMLLARRDIILERHP